MDPPLIQPPLAMSQQIVRPPQSTQDWESQKAKIAELYESNELKDTMKVMEEQHGFKATVNQYKKQLGKWGLDHKRIKDSEYQAILNKKRKRELEDPQKRSAFRLRGAKVDSSKIARYKKRKGLNEDNVASNVGTPSDLSCYTPSVISSSPLPSSIGIVNLNDDRGFEPATDSRSPLVFIDIPSHVDDWIIHLAKFVIESITLLQMASLEILGPEILQLDQSSLQQKFRLRNLHIEMQMCYIGHSSQLKVEIGEGGREKATAKVFEVVANVSDYGNGDQIWCMAVKAIDNSLAEEAVGPAPRSFHVVTRLREGEIITLERLGVAIVQRLGVATGKSRFYF